MVVPGLSRLELGATLGALVKSGTANVRNFAYDEGETVEYFVSEYIVSIQQNIYLCRWSGDAQQI